MQDSGCGGEGLEVECLSLPPVSRILYLFLLILSSYIVPSAAGADRLPRVCFHHHVPRNRVLPFPTDRPPPRSRPHFPTAARQSPRHPAPAQAAVLSRLSEPHAASSSSVLPA